MFGITGHTRVYIRTGATDGRLGFEGLKALTVNVIREDARLSAYRRGQEDRSPEVSSTAFHTQPADLPVRP